MIADDLKRSHCLPPNIMEQWESSDIHIDRSDTTSHVTVFHLNTTV